MWKRYVTLSLAPIFLVLAGCATYSVPRYSSSPNIAIKLRKLHNQYPNGAFTVGSFTPPTNGDDEITCRLAGPISVPDNQDYTQYIRSSLKDELALAQMYKSADGILIAGNVKKVDFSSTSGQWIIDAAISMANQPPFTVTEKYGYDTSFVAVSACRVTAKAYEAAVQDLIKKIIAAPQFTEALKTQQQLTAQTTGASIPGESAGRAPAP